MNHRERDIVIAFLGATAEVGLTLLLAGSTLPTWLKVVLLALPLVSTAGYFCLRSRLRQRRTARRPVPQRQRRLQELYKAKGAIIQGWFVSFTAGPYPTSTDPEGRYATAIAEVDQVDGDEVRLRWRDHANLPTCVPVQLLDANEVVRFREGRQVRTRNEGLCIRGPGASVTGSGWNAHRESPWRSAFVRYAELAPEHQQAMDAEADLRTYDLDRLKKT